MYKTCDGAMVDKFNRKLDLFFFREKKIFKPSRDARNVGEILLPKPDQLLNIYFCRRGEYLSALSPTKKVTTLPKVDELCHFEPEKRQTPTGDRLLSEESLLILRTFSWSNLREMHFFLVMEKGNSRFLRVHSSIGISQ
ncbi:hypothetical protein JTE90_016079 [Oedothorax gibbosus]|uniref:Uncharacterized protein n=1 Tax=Oedothorax gibbosus TaxID=931172 RepID=A0AAV6TNK4_9ARAC|nr:hypothetical protein JTE90_016079 [Oedothorax gibbosus]